MRKVWSRGLHPAIDENLKIVMFGNSPEISPWST
jgi:hypothetical protein